MMSGILLFPSAGALAFAGALPRTLCFSCDCCSDLCHVRACSGSLIKGEVLVDADQPQALTSRRLEVEVGVRHFELPDETGLEDLAAQFLHVVGLDFQPDRSSSPQELALVRDIPIEKPDIEVFAQTKEVPFVLLFRDDSPEDITIEVANAVSISLRNEDRSVVSENDLSHHRSPSRGVSRQLPLILVSSGKALNALPSSVL